MKNKKLRSKSITGKKMVAGKKVKAKLQPGGAKSAPSLKMKKTLKPGRAVKRKKRLQPLTGSSAKRLNSTKPTPAPETAAPSPTSTSTPVAVIDTHKRKRQPGGDSDRGFYLRLGDEQQGPINKALVKAAADKAKMSMNAYAAAAVMHMVENGLPSLLAEGMDPTITDGDIAGDEGEDAGLDTIAQPA